MGVTCTPALPLHHLTRYKRLQHLLLLASLLLLACALALLLKEFAVTPLPSPRWGLRLLPYLALAPPHPAADDTTTARETLSQLLLRQSRRRWPACDAWIQQYAALHASITQQQGPAGRYFMHSCTGATSLYCAGIGDRIRAMMESVKLAHYSQRAVLFQWTRPAELELVLQPSAIDWRLKPGYQLDAVQRPVSYVWSTWLPWSANASVPPDLADGTFAAEQSRLITVTSNFVDQKGLLRGPSLGKIDSNARSCLFQALFKPSDDLEQQVREMRRRLFGGASVEYVAVHLRLGSFDGEWRAVERFTPFTGLMAVLSCARALAAAHNLTAPLLLLTDNAMLRQHLRDGALAGVVTTPFAATHVLNPRAGQGARALATSFLDLALLAQARCFIGSPSGFTHVGLAWGRHGCFLQVQQCMAAYTGLPAHSCESPPCWL